MTKEIIDVKPEELSEVEKAKQVLEQAEKEKMEKVMTEINEILIKNGYEFRVINQIHIAKKQ